MNKHELLKKKVLKWESFLVLLLLVEILVFGLINPKFLIPRVLFGSINNFMTICIVSIFVTFVLITGGIDIQAGSIVGLTSIFIGVLWNDAGVNLYIACILGLVLGVLCGTLSGFFVAYTGVQPMVVTLGGSFLYSGLALMVTNFSSTESYKGISGFPEEFTQFVKGKIFVQEIDQTPLTLKDGQHQNGSYGLWIHIRGKGIRGLHFRRFRFLQGFFRRHGGFEPFARLAPRNPLGDDPEEERGCTAHTENSRRQVTFQQGGVRLQILEAASHLLGKFRTFSGDQRFHPRIDCGEHFPAGQEEGGQKRAVENQADQQQLK